MKIIASGVRHDGNVIQETVVVTDENGGTPDHINSWKIRAAALGHRWIDIHPVTYANFKHRADLESHVAKLVEK